MRQTVIVLAAILAALALLAPSASADGWLFDLTTADAEGSFDGAMNVGGWAYLQEVLETYADPFGPLGAGLIVSLGTAEAPGVTSGDAGAAARSAFDHSGLSGFGFTFAHVDGVTAIEEFFQNVGPGPRLSDTTMILMDSGQAANSMDTDERALLTAHQNELNNFLSSGGVIHSQAQDGPGQYEWLTTLNPAVSFDLAPGVGVQFSPFSPLYDTVPYVGHWTGFGGSTAGFGMDTYLTSLSGLPVGIGASGGNVNNAGIPEPTTVAIFGLGGLGLGALGLLRRRRR